jgi:hypothetical protein
MPKYRCTVKGGSEEQTSRGAAAEIFEKIYPNVEAESSDEAEATARELAVQEFAHMRVERVACKRETLLAISEATEAALTDPEHRIRLAQAAARDGATMDEVAAAKRETGHWPD